MLLLNMHDYWMIRHHGTHYEGYYWIIIKHHDTHYEVTIEWYYDIMALIMRTQLNDNKTSWHSLWGDY